MVGKVFRGADAVAPQEPPPPAEVARLAKWSSSVTPKALLAAIATAATTAATVGLSTPGLGLVTGGVASNGLATTFSLAVVGAAVVTIASSTRLLTVREGKAAVKGAATGRVTAMAVECSTSVPNMDCSVGVLKTYAKAAPSLPPVDNNTAQEASGPALSASKCASALLGVSAAPAQEAPVPRTPMGMRRRPMLPSLDDVNADDDQSQASPQVADGSAAVGADGACASSCSASPAASPSASCGGASGGSSLSLRRRAPPALMTFGSSSSLCDEDGDVVAEEDADSNTCAAEESPYSSPDGCSEKSSVASPARAFSLPLQVGCPTSPTRLQRRRPQCIAGGSKSPSPLRPDCVQDPESQMCNGTWKPRYLDNLPTPSSRSSPLNLLLTPGTPDPQRSDLKLISGDVACIMFDFDGTLTASPGDSAQRSRKQVELRERAPLLAPRLRAFREAGIMLGIISKSSALTITTALQEAGLTDFFNGPIFPKAVGFEGKAGFIDELLRNGRLGPRLGADDLSRVMLIDDDVRELDRARARGIQTYSAPVSGGLQDEDFDDIFMCMGLMPEETSLSVSPSKRNSSRYRTACWRSNSGGVLPPLPQLPQPSCSASFGGLLRLESVGDA